MRLLPFIELEGRKVIRVLEGWGTDPKETGAAVFTNQTGGIACHHPTVVGEDATDEFPALAAMFDALEVLCVNLMCGDLLKDEFEKLRAEIDNILSASGFALAHAPGMLAASEEAWLFVVRMRGRYDRPFLLTWDNSD